MVSRRRVLEGSAGCASLEGSTPAAVGVERVVPTDRDAGDAFGAATAITPDGSTAVIRAPRDEAPNEAGQHPRS